MALLETQKLTASYGTGNVLHDIDFSIDEGEAVGIVGPNGHGKTTLLRAISGLMPRSSGRILFAGESITKKAADKIAASGLVHVPQGDLVYPNMTILDNLLVGGYSNASQQVTQAQLGKVFGLFPRLRERTGQMASSLSGGERRMLGIGRGLMMADIRILMLDEPSLGLAPVVIEQIYQAVQDLRADGMTVIIVEENVMRAASVVGRLHLMDSGQFVWSGTPDEMKENKQIIDTYLGA
ncbi:ABC transporter ATP-binding protein [Methyloligella solikamskensis]|uniref:ABC transporter ATP-binding protein n=1 Tax=Methyloligella solikamskensis TaxID=1177756 RepID=A0ABW3JA05_9HYPH